MNDIFPTFQLFVDILTRRKTIRQIKVKWILLVFHALRIYFNKIRDKLRSNAFYGILKLKAYIIMHFPKKLQQTHSMGTIHRKALHKMHLRSNSGQKFLRKNLS